MKRFSNHAQLARYIAEETDSDLSACEVLDRIDEQTSD